ncbi:hypothetical protein A9K55_007627 [Cordyceps militaris]|uniref:Transmembrane protein n=1 Tax=Cordyceps militaris TaxID=73501 RepID=A0A2H4SJH0_CORMI|nr:hypothetical protein A9K55_007627 [Cordyceps militaris]
MPPTAETAPATPAQIAALSVSIFAILVFTGVSIYLCGRHKSCKSCNESTHHAIRRVSHLGHRHNHHHHQHNHTHERIPSTTTSCQCTNGGRFTKLEDGSQGTGGGRFTKLKEAFGIKAVTAVPAAVIVDKQMSLPTTETEAFGQAAPTTRATSPLHIGIHPVPARNPCSGEEEFQAAVHNLLGYQAAGELQAWYSSSSSSTSGESDDDSAHQDVHPEPREERFSAIGPREGSPPLPAYEEVAEPRRFSWQGDESDYRPEKR